MLGDFNAYYPWWNSTCTATRSKTLTTWLARYYCELVNTPDIDTYTQFSEQTLSVIDLAFATPSLYSSIIDWQINEDLPTGSDHEVIQFSLCTDNIELVDSPFEASFNIKKAN